MLGIGIPVRMRMLLLLPIFPIVAPFLGRSATAQPPDSTPIIRDALSGAEQVPTLVGVVGDPPADDDGDAIAEDEEEDEACVPTTGSTTSGLPADMLVATEEAFRQKYTALATQKHQLRLRTWGGEFSVEEKDGVYVEFQDMRSTIERRGAPLQARQTESTLPKNRYKDILPIESTRVKLPLLPGDDSSDYINANYIKGYSGGIDYIAAQALLQNTIADFWRMCWEGNEHNGVNAILMLTRLVEGNRRKSERYWPQQGDREKHGEIWIRSLGEHEQDGFIVRKFLMSRANDRREILQVHYTSWPDFSVPRNNAVIAPMLKFVRDLREVGRPTLIHCSAGVGRTGTFIAIDILLEQLEHTYKQGSSDLVDLDVKTVVAMLRGQRMSSVMTVEQYEFIYTYLLQNAFQSIKLDNDDDDGPDGSDPSWPVEVLQLVAVLAAALIATVWVFARVAA